MPKRTIYVTEEDELAIRRWMSYFAETRPEAPKHTFSSALVGLARAQLSFQRKKLSGAFKPKARESFETPYSNTEQHWEPMNE